MTDQITLTGIVATDPRRVTTTAGLDIVSFRLASTQRRYDRARNEWVDGDTNWYTITTFRALARNTAASIQKGHRVIVTGTLHIRAWENGAKSGTTVEVTADHLGHDLLFTTTNPATAITRSETAAGHDDVVDADEGSYLASEAAAAWGDAMADR